MDHVEAYAEADAEQFGKLRGSSEMERQAIFRRLFVAPCSVEFEAADIEEQEPEAIRFRHFMEQTAQSQSERQYKDEARSIFYRENSFVVWAKDLGNFLSGRYGDPNSQIPVCELVRDMTVALCCPSASFQNDADGLAGALCLMDLEKLSIELWGNGAYNGSDFPTQRMIRSIAKTVKSLIIVFGHRLTISKILLSWQDWSLTPFRGWATNPYDLRPYWVEPSAATIKNVEFGKGSFEELMQVQIAMWTGLSSVSWPDVSWSDMDNEIDW